jgi:glycosyltransferase involved in cell wall biosynthesis
MLNRNHRIYIIADFPFPVGLAGSNRIHAYAKGFGYHGFDSVVLCFRKNESQDNVLNEYSEGIYNGVKYKYLSKSTIKSRFFIKRRIDNYVMVFRLFLYSLFVINKNSSIIFYSTLTHAAVLLKVSALIKGFNLIKEENEHPSIRINTKGKLSGLVFKTIHYKLFDGILIITHILYEYFSTKYSKIPILHVPMLVDLDRFSVKVQKERIITYSGVLSKHKDGVDILIKSFSEILADFPDYKLNLIGEAFKKEERLQLEKLIDDLELKEKVIFLGRIKNDEIPGQISKSSILVLPRPDSIQARNGFPTKLGEYLATGIPVIATSVGEIPHYLKDNVNAFLAIPGSIDSLVSKLKEALKDPIHSSKIGMEGKKTAEKYFDNKLQTQRMLEFMNHL